MEWINTFRNTEVAKVLTNQLNALSPKPARIMEVCGTHTVSIAHNGLRELMPEGLTLTSGPGCPVCVTSTTEIDTFIAASKLKNVIITTFGDLIKVPGSRSSLKKEQTDGADIRIVYSPLDAVEIARQNSHKKVIFLGIGFETTTPTVAAAILQAQKEGLNNFFIISAHKLMPPALEALVSDPEITLDGLICPGHVSIMIGSQAYQPLVDKYHIPCVIAGFEAVDILHGIYLLARQQQENRAEVEISYQRAVYQKGNPKAVQIMEQVFETVPAIWRGLGEIPASGLQVRPEFREFDAEIKFDMKVPVVQDKPGCKCGDVLKGIINPDQCQLFKKACLPEHPIGPCMVSSEGACAAFYRYRR